MFSGCLGHSCFGPAEIGAMRRAQALADHALRTQACEGGDFNQRRQEVARLIIHLAGEGLLDPLALSTEALRANRAALLPAATFRAYDRRCVSTRMRIRRVSAACKIA